ncbi:SRPBCC family protein, partial [Methylosinus sp. R-45379]|uniref:SRPBCC family protein n=1 Tax=Methylosinus sp. R-45379 TaxID=980563 RepID=UPI000B0F9E39
LYGLALAGLSRIHRVASPGVVLATALDFLWVIGSVALPTIRHVPNAEIVFAQAAVVLVFVELQLLGIRRSIFVNGIGGFALERVVQGSIDRAWNVVSDVARYAEVADTLHSSQIVSGEGLGMVRECEDDSGACWLETCTRWEPGRAYAFDVDTTAPRYPLPLKAMRGDFEVEALDASRTLVRIRFSFTPRGGLMTEHLLALVFAMRGDAVVGGILRRWARLIEAPAKTNVQVT